jgi:hypothetical protein
MLGLRKEFFDDDDDDDDDDDECSWLLRENTRRMLRYSRTFTKFGLIIRKFFLRSRLFPLDLSLFLR